jgi:hypothetical protein
MFIMPFLTLLFFFVAILIAVVISFTLALRSYYFYKQSQDPLLSLTMKPQSIMANLQAQKEIDEVTWT